MSVGRIGTTTREGGGCDAMVDAEKEGGGWGARTGKAQMMHAIVQVGLSVRTALIQTEEAT